MQLDVCSANNLSSLCQRITKVELKLGVPRSNIARTNIPRKNQFNDVSILCQRIKRLEGLVGIKTVPKAPGYQQLGPSGNAVIANKLNLLCGRLTRVEKKINLA